MDHTGSYVSLMDYVEAGARPPPVAAPMGLRVFSVGYCAIVTLLVLPYTYVVATQGWGAPCDKPLLFWASVHVFYHLVKGLLLGTRHCPVLVADYPGVMRAASCFVNVIELFALAWWFQGAQWLWTSATCNTTVYCFGGTLFVLQTIFILIPLVSLVICLPLLSAYVLALLYWYPGSPAPRVTSEEVIQKIGTYAWDAVLRCQQTVECSICLADFADGDEVMELPCAARHLFHAACALTWLRTSQHCPLCRSNILDIIGVDDEKLGDP